MSSTGAIHSVAQSGNTNLSQTGRSGSGMWSARSAFMGILDLKLGPDGELVWLEINPHGQFMFLEGLGSGIRLSRPFCDFLRAEALTSQRSLSPPGSQAASVPEQEPRRCGTKQDNTR